MKRIPKIKKKFGILIIVWILIIIYLGALVLQSFMGVEIKKPAIYLYPREKTNISVLITINGKITHSEPNYNYGWNIVAEPNGMIDGRYDYLFYEARLRNKIVQKEGWVVRYSNLEEWFDRKLPQLGLNLKEISQFKDYWLNELPKSNYYEIKLLSDKFLNDNMNLIIAPKPDTIIRRIFYFKPTQSKTTLVEPQIYSERKGFTVVEWGGFIDK